MKRVIIIGASSGMGKELALRYAAEGHFVGISGRRAALLAKIKKRFPERIVSCCFDVTGTENQKQLLQLIADLGGLDLIIYNAGFGEPSETLDVKTEMEITRTGVNGCVEIVGTAFNYFLERGSGQIAITSSVAALRGNSWTPAYSASKAFVSNYAEGLNIKARKLEKDIVITDIRPGFVGTKPANVHGRFWVASTQKATTQIIGAIEKKKRVAYITRRWWLVAQLLKLVPFGLYRRFA